MIIVGAGPAGCASALMLSSQGLKVGLVNFQKGTPFKIGESLPGAAIRLLRKLGIADLNQLMGEESYLPTTANASAWGSDDWHYQDALFNPEGGGWHLDRKHFDKALLAEATRKGVVSISGKVIKVQRDKVDGQVSVSVDGSQAALDGYQCKWIIDASGRSRSVIRQLGDRRSAESHEQMSVVTWVKANQDDLDKATRIKSVENGWWYTAKLPDQHRVIAFFGDADDVSTLVKAPDLLIRSFNEVQLVSDQRWSENDLLDLQVSKAHASMAQQVIGKQWLAVGDAALSLDPLSSQGIFFGLYSGIKGAETILAEMENPDRKGEIQLEYHAAVKQVFEEHQKARKYHYLQEMRYIDQPYWAHWFHPVEG